MIGPQQVYRINSVETAAPADLVLMLYQGMLRFTQRGILAIERKDLTSAHNSLVRAQEIVAELIATLAMEQGGPLAANLRRLYDYAYFCLVDANCQKSAAPAEAAIQVFRELMPAWQTIADQQRRQSTENPLSAPLRLAV